MRLLFSHRPVSGVTAGIFLDRDGVINEQIAEGYVTRWREFRFVPGIFEALAGLADLGVPVIVVSNQAAVEKGLVTRAELEQITRRFVGCLRRKGARIDAVYYCPHVPGRRCSCRKPQPGLLGIAAREWRLDLGSSVLVGDSAVDVQAAHAAGCSALLIDRTRNLVTGPLIGADGAGAGPIPDRVGEWLRASNSSQAVKQTVTDRTPTIYR